MSIPAVKPKPMTLTQQRLRDGFWLLFPGLLVIFGITLFPIIYTFVLSFTETPISNPTPQGFIGIRNYLYFLSNSVFWAAIRRTLYFTIVSVSYTHLTLPTIYSV